MARRDNIKGIEYAAGVTGKRSYRVSEQYLADHIVPLVAKGRTDAAKLDLALRGIALSPEHAGKRLPGTVLRKRVPLDYAAMHDLVRDPRRFATGLPEDDDADRIERDKKREWVREQLVELESRRLLQRDDLGDGRYQVIVASDLGDGALFDDPGAKETRRSYITILGAVIADDRFRHWGARELVGFLCAMIADRYARTAHQQRTGEELPHGSATWYRQADWFNNGNGFRSEGNIIPGFSTTTIERGLKAMRNLGYIDADWSMYPPGGGKRFLHRRMIYTNHFDQLERSANDADVINLDDLRRSA